ncbi:MAG: hypothetical protein RLN60_03005 [Phycisphaerales bacterium]
MDDPNRTSRNAARLEGVGDELPGEPYCGACGYTLVGLITSSECPECGTPFVDGLRRRTMTGGGHGKRYTSDATFLGYPLISVAFGPDPERGERFGRARGVIALGDRAQGGIAIGGGAVGIVAIGGGAIGVCSIGGGAIGLGTAFGGGAIGGLALGGGAIGGIAVGGGAIGYVARGGFAGGVYANGGSTAGRHELPMTGQNADPKAVQLFDTLAPIMGVPNTVSARFGVVIGAIDLCIAVLIVLFVAIMHAQHSHAARAGDPNP